jgi:hypothetical protein
MMERKEGKVSDTPTPRTDAFFDALYKDVPDEMTELSAGQEREFARQLERELTAAQDRIDDLTATGIHSCGNECKRPNCVLRRELSEATKQRDALADALRRYDTDSELSEGEETQIFVTHEDQKALRGALATLEGRTE